MGTAYPLVIGSMLVPHLMFWKSVRSSMCSRDESYLRTELWTLTRHRPVASARSRGHAGSFPPGNFDADVPRPRVLSCPRHVAQLQLLEAERLQRGADEARGDGADVQKALDIVDVDRHGVLALED